MQCKILSDKNSDCLEEAINDFLKDIDDVYVVKNIVFSVTSSGKIDWLYAMILYE